MKEESPRKMPVRPKFQVKLAKDPVELGLETSDGVTNLFEYSAENAIKEGTGILKSAKKLLEGFDLGSKMRKDVWMGEIKSLLDCHPPETLIGICGETGVGKSSLLNALLDDIIVPTNSSRACTATITEVSHHDKDGIEAEINFLGLEEWKREIDTLIGFLIDEDGSFKPGSVLREEGKILLSKIQTVYPRLKPQDIVSMGVDRILEDYAEVTKVLGTKELINATDSRQFQDQTAKYLKPPSKLIFMTEAKHTTGQSYWPIISHVRVRCRAKVLSKGAILVDLPGIGDANAARNSISQNYLMRCDCIWIVAHSNRAADSKGAQGLLSDSFKLQLLNGKYKDTKVAFITTHTDNIDADEVIKDLELEDDPLVEENDICIERINLELEDLELRKEGIKQELMERKLDKRWLSDDEKDCSSSPKRHKGNVTGDTPSWECLNHEISDSNSDDPSQISDHGDAMPVDDQEYDKNQRDAKLDARVEAAKLQLKDLREKILSLKTERGRLKKEMHQLKNKKEELQRAQKLLCAKRRSKYIQEALKDVFRSGLRQMEEEIAERENPETFDPTQTIRDYQAINLPVFTCSSREYLRLKNLTKGSSKTLTFADPADTEIPRLRDFCYTMTSRARNQTAIRLLHRLSDFLHSIVSYMSEVESVSVKDRLLLQEMWETKTQALEIQKAKKHRFLSASDSGSDYCPSSESEREHKLPASCKSEIEMDGNQTGIVVRLWKAFSKISDDTVANIKTKFHDGLEDRCRAGALKAQAMASLNADSFATSMHWQTYRATIRRDGEFKHDLNLELVNPLTKEIALSWARTFESNLFGAMETAILEEVGDLIKDIDATSPAGLKDRCKALGEAVLETVRHTTQPITDSLKAIISSEQQNISRSLSPKVRDEMKDAYRRAKVEAGAGCVKRQKLIIKDHVNNIKDYVFTGVSDIILERLDKTAVKVQKGLEGSLLPLSQKVEVSMSSLWKTPRMNEQQKLKQREVAEKMGQLSNIVSKLRTKALEAQRK